MSTEPACLSVCLSKRSRECMSIGGLVDNGLRAQKECAGTVWVNAKKDRESVCVCVLEQSG